MPSAAVVGDVIKHGTIVRGTLSTGTSKLLDGGKKVCLQDVVVVCSQHGTTSILPSTCCSEVLVDGKKVVLDGSKTACGATVTGTGSKSDFPAP